MTRFIVVSPDGTDQHKRTGWIMATKKAKQETKVEQIARNVIKIDFPYVHAGWEQWILLSSDRHFDSIHSDRDLQEEHLKKVKERNAYVADFGDIFDAMQGKYDPRRSYSDLRPEYKVENYLDEIVKDAGKFYRPYADRILVLGRGNHESSILKNNGVDLVSNLAYELNRDGAHVYTGEYGGWIIFEFGIGGTQKVAKRLKYFHGAGGGGPVTRGVIQTNRQAVYLPDADIVVNGHTHDAWHVPIQRERISPGGNVYQDTQHHIRTASYKDEYRDGAGGWHVETWKPPKPVGAAWLKFSYASEKRRSYIRVDVMQELKQV